MAKLLMTIGISGSGKSKYITDNYKDTLSSKVCPDDIRREITGKVSDMSQDSKVWKTAYERTIKNLKETGYSIFDATHVNSKTFLKTINTIRNEVKETSIQCIAFTPNVSLCQQRIIKDINECRDRSKVPLFVVEKQAANIKNWHDSFFKTGQMNLPNVEVQFIDSETHLEITHNDFIKSL